MWANMYVCASPYVTEINMCSERAVHTRDNTVHELTCLSTAPLHPLTQNSDGFRISPRWGRQPSGGEHTILSNFPKNCMKLKEFGSWGGARLLPPLDPPLWFQPPSHPPSRPIPLKVVVAILFCPLGTAMLDCHFSYRNPSQMMRMYQALLLCWIELVPNHNLAIICTHHLTPVLPIRPFCVVHGYFQPILCQFCSLSTE